MITIKLKRNKIIVATCKLEIESEESNISFLSNVHIKSEFRNKGYCYFLIKKAINYLTRRKIKKVYSHVKYDNDKAIKCYKSNGFKIIKKNKSYGKLYGYTMSINI
jgi:ribosomal protein S18 acetylase RimI-like enzyme